MDPTLKFFKLLKSLFIRDDVPTGGGGAVTTLTEPAEPGDLTITVASIVGIGVGNALRIGREAVRVHASTAPSGNTVTLAAPGILLAHEDNEEVVEQVVYDIGDVVEGGVRFEVLAPVTKLISAMSRFTWQTLPGYFSTAFAWVFPTFRPEYLCIALGMRLDRVIGDGLAIETAKILQIDGSEIGEISNRSIIGVALLEDGTVVRGEQYGLAMDPSGLAVTFARGNQGTIAARGISRDGGILSTTDTPFIGSSAIVADPQDVILALEEVGLRIPDTGATATELESDVVAGSLVLPVPAGTVDDVVALGYILLGSGATIEALLVESIDTGTDEITLITPTKHDHAVGEPVVPATTQKFAAITDAGVTVTFGVEATDRTIGTAQNVQGRRIGNVDLTVTFALQDLTLANFARALGLDPATILGGTLLPVFSGIGGADIECMYLRGVTKSGEIIVVDMWGISADVANFAIELSRTAGTLPHSWNPRSGLQFLFYQAA